MNISKWSLQRIFNYVAKHLLEQGKKAQKYSPEFHNMACVCYDEKTGRRCAVGCLMPLSFYKRGNEDIELDDLMYELEVTSNQQDFLEYLQEIHDSFKPSRWPERLRTLAKQNNLTVPEFLKKGL